MAKFCLTLQMLKASLVAPPVILEISNMTTLYSLTSRWSDAAVSQPSDLQPDLIVLFDPADVRGSAGVAASHLCDLQPDLIILFDPADVRGSAGGSSLRSPT
jgi:hypothetical protein